jgi:hypothetical protein
MADGGQRVLIADDCPSTSATVEGLAAEEKGWPEPALSKVEVLRGG